MSFAIAGCTSFGAVADFGHRYFTPQVCRRLHESVRLGSITIGWLRRSHCDKWTTWGRMEFECGSSSEWASAARMAIAHGAAINTVVFCTTRYRGGWTRLSALCEEHVTVWRFRLALGDATRYSEGTTAIRDAMWQSMWRTGGVAMARQNVVSD